MGRPATPCKLGAKRVRSVRCRGGNMKYRALRLDSGNYAWGSASQQEVDDVRSGKSKKPQQKLLVNDQDKTVQETY